MENNMLDKIDAELYRTKLEIDNLVSREKYLKLTKCSYLSGGSPIILEKDQWNKLPIGSNLIQIFDSKFIYEKQ